MIDLFLIEVNQINDNLYVSLLRVKEQLTNNLN